MLHGGPTSDFSQVSPVHTTGKNVRDQVILKPYEKKLLSQRSDQRNLYVSKLRCSDLAEVVGGSLDD